MLNSTEVQMLAQYLAEQSHVDAARRLPEGSLLGEWRVLALLGRGGSGEVYRVVHSVTSQEAAVKILCKSERSAYRRFEQEAEFLRANTLPQFPRFYATGVYDGSPYLVQELLAPVEIGGDDRSVANYLIAVSKSVAALHRAGFVHRDLKPKNIMRRSTGEVVLIDFGLAKDVGRISLPRKEVSIDSGKVVAVGTLGYAAPEQLLEGMSSAAADIHALGRMANAAFGGHPPRCWEAIIRRATSSIPDQRYQTVEDFIAAIRCRHVSEWIIRALIAVACFAGLLTSVFCYWQNGGAEAYTWRSLQEQVVVPVVEQCVLSETWITNAQGRAFCTQRISRSVTNEIEMTMIRLNGTTNVFVHPLVLKGDRTYRIVGPGVLEATIASEKSNVTLRLKDCVIRNQTSVPMSEAGLRYVFEGGVLLDFPQLDRVPLNSSDVLVDYDAAFNRVRFKKEKH